MGLLKTVEYKGITIPNAYHRVGATASQDDLCNAVLNIHVSRDTYLEGIDYFDQYSFTFNLEHGEGVGSDKDQAYIFLKNSEEFKNATDVFEEET